MRKIRLRTHKNVISSRLFSQINHILIISLRIIKIVKNHVSLHSFLTRVIPIRTIRFRYTQMAAVSTSELSELVILDYLRIVKF